jgi:hypothetical protein
MSSSPLFRTNGYTFFLHLIVASFGQRTEICTDMPPVWKIEIEVDFIVFV